MIVETTSDWIIDDVLRKGEWEGTTRIFVNSGNNDCIVFVFDLEYNLYVQYPYFLVPVPYSEEKTMENCTKAIKSAIKNESAALHSLAIATSICRNDVLTKNEQKERLKELYDRTPWYMAGSDKKHAIKTILGIS